ncbi:hypothetical protein [Paenisporosarcina sp. TG20]|uniref:hypothetical protein n=1 Tax=Paenisporosarcina sp. TG20 TaxID=1211706 RepID=UPI0002E6238E|nr:hypothetical protein [Paenisporosarcina sp. TG20]
MNYGVIESVWLATAIMTYEKLCIGENPTVIQMYFKQSDIQKRAQSLTTNNVNSARIS